MSDKETNIFQVTLWLLKTLCFDTDATEATYTLTGVTGPDGELLGDWETDFDKKFHERIWQIVKKISPMCYAAAESYGLLDSDGPQIYGEIKAFIRNQIYLAESRGIYQGMTATHNKASIDRLIADAEQRAVERCMKAFKLRPLEQFQPPYTTSTRSHSPDFIKGYRTARNDLQISKTVFLKSEVAKEGNGT